MAVTEGDQALTQIKAVDSAWPLTAPPASTPRFRWQKHWRTTRRVARRDH
jgi:predicted lysophospholipase L1 biosynthesis ABC-type transport system permease subunit